MWIGFGQVVAKNCKAYSVQTKGGTTTAGCPQKWSTNNSAALVDMNMIDQGLGIEAYSKSDVSSGGM